MARYTVGENDLPVLGLFEGVQHSPAFIVPVSGNAAVSQQAVDVIDPQFPAKTVEHFQRLFGHARHLRLDEKLLSRQVLDCLTNHRMCPVAFGRVDIGNSLVIRIVYQPVETVGSQGSLDAAAFAAGSDAEPAHLQSRLA